jgi:hypothetical protein
MAKTAHEAFSEKIKRNYGTHWMTTEVLECINLKKASDKCLSSK